MRAQSIFGKGSIARGLALIAWLGVLTLSGQQIWRAWDPGDLEGRAPAPACPTPIEIVTPSGPRLGCAGDSSLGACGPLQAGDRVTPATCEVTGMSAPARLLEGLPLDLNRATLSDLELLDGVGPKKAAAIIADREARGRFDRVEDLGRVRGIGAATVEKLAPQLAVSGVDGQRR